MLMSWTRHCAALHLGIANLAGQTRAAIIITVLAVLLLFLIFHIIIISSNSIAFATVHTTSHDTTYLTSWKVWCIGIV